VPELIVIKKAQERREKPDTENPQRLPPTLDERIESQPIEALPIFWHNAMAVVQGFGNVASYAAHELHHFGLKVIAVSDHTGALHDPGGLDIPALMRHAGSHGSIAGFSKEMQFDPAQILTLSCDVLVPAAVERVIDAKVAENQKCRILAEGANGLTTPEADLVLEKRKDEIFFVPDILCEECKLRRDLDANQNGLELHMLLGASRRSSGEC
jgi:glutamate dehydrogenase/leucine dehydrogenase